MKSFGSCYWDRCQGLKEGFTGQSVVQARVLTHREALSAVVMSPKPLDPVLHPPTHTPSHCHNPPRTDQHSLVVHLQWSAYLKLWSGGHICSEFSHSRPERKDMRVRRSWRFTETRHTSSWKNSPHLNRRASHKYLSFSSFWTMVYIY